MQNNDADLGGLSNKLRRHLGLSKAQAGDTRTILGSTPANAKPITLGAEPVRVMLTPQGSDSLASKIDRLSPDRKLYLILQGLAARLEPGAKYHVYMGLPPVTKPALDDPHHVGTFTFFGVAGASAAPGNTEARSYSIDVTESVKRLQAGNLRRDPLSVTIVPSGMPVKDSAARIAAIALVAD